jgi:hypothetical protein
MELLKVKGFLQCARFVHPIRFRMGKKAMSLTASSQLDNASITPAFHWKAAEQPSVPTGGTIDPLRSLCRQTLLYKIPDRLQVQGELVALSINISYRSSCIGWGFIPFLFIFLGDCGVEPVGPIDFHLWRAYRRA